jgi:hypothetical protein
MSPSHLSQPSRQLSPGSSHRTVVNHSGSWASSLAHTTAQQVVDSSSSSREAGRSASLPLQTVPLTRRSDMALPPPPAQAAGWRRLWQQEQQGWPFIQQQQRWRRGNSAPYTEPPCDYGGHYGVGGHHTAGGMQYNGRSLSAASACPKTLAQGSSSSSSRLVAAGAGFLGRSQPRAASAGQQYLSGPLLGGLLVTGQPLGTAAAAGSSSSARSSSGLAEITPAEDYSAVLPLGSHSSSTAVSAGSNSSSSGGSSQPSTSLLRNSSSGSRSPLSAYKQQACGHS